MLKNEYHYAHFTLMNLPVFTSYFFAPISTYCDISKYDHILIEAQESYQKRSFRNKCIICSAQGPETISVPLRKGKNNQCPILETKISYIDDWVSQTIKTIRACYGKAPYYDDIVHDIEEILGQNYESLFELNTKVLTWTIEFIGLNVKFSNTQVFENESYAKDYRGKQSPKTYSLEPMKPYTQLFSDRLPFHPNLSILDLLFCKGPEAILYLRQNQQ